MNQTYCGDSRDLFKYDLIHTILDQVSPDISSFLFIPMVTPYNPDAGRKIPGVNNKELVKLFTPFAAENGMVDYFREIRHFFESRGIRIKIENPMPFERKHRVEYFSRIQEHIPERALIFFDPDTGLKEENATEKHLKYSEMKKIFDLMDRHSILMVYQHFPRYSKSDTRKDFPKTKAQDLEKFIKITPLFISDGGILFFFLTKEDEVHQRLKRILHGYRERYPDTLTS